MEAEGKGTPEEMASRAHDKLYDPASTCRVRVLATPSQVVTGRRWDGANERGDPQPCLWGRVRAHAVHGQKCINAKTSKRQMENAPSLRWLFVVLDANEHGSGAA